MSNVTVEVETKRQAAPEADELVVRLRPVGVGPPAAVRFRSALKRLLRDHGLRAEWVPAAPAKEGK